MIRTKVQLTQWIGQKSLLLPKSDESKRLRKCIRNVKNIVIISQNSSPYSRLCPSQGLPELWCHWIQQGHSPCMAVIHLPFSMNPRLQTVRTLTLGSKTTMAVSCWNQLGFVTIFWKRHFYFLHSHSKQFHSSVILTKPQIYQKVLLLTQYCWATTFSHTRNTEGRILVNKHSWLVPF